MADQATCRRIYAKGFFDGLRKAEEANQEESMNAQKLQLLASQQTSAASNVFEAVPISQPWTVSEICSELRRLGKKSESRFVTGCLNSLSESGLIREVKKGEFVRVTAREKPARPVLAQVSSTEQIKEKAEVAVTIANKPERVEPMERLAVAAKNTRDLAEKIRAMADEIEEIALDVDERIQKIHADTAKLRQLQDLLKSIGQ